MPAAYTDQAFQPVDAVVVGAGIGGLYAAWRLLKQGLTVAGVESASGVGGVWFHNRYPGARVDVDSEEYCYFFDDDLYREWEWSERYAAQPELLSYLNHVADRFDLRRHFRFDSTVNAATWDPAAARWMVSTDDGARYAARFLLMTSGNLSAGRTPDFPGLDQFQGEQYQTSRWPHTPVSLKGKRVGVIGTGSSGVQAVPEIAKDAEHLYVFQRSPNYSVPARNGAPDKDRRAKIVADVPAARAHLRATAGGIFRTRSQKTAAEYTAQEQRERLQAQWDFGGVGMGYVFRDQGTNMATNDIVSEFVRDKIRATVDDPAVADKLCPQDHPLGSRRLVINTAYYETFNRPNVTLVDLREEPIEHFTAHGVTTSKAEYPLDVIVFALGFVAFTGAIDRANITNDKGQRPTDSWGRGPRTYLGLMTSGFPNLFIVTGPGSPTVVANMAVMNEQHIDLVADMIAHMDARGLATVEPEPQAEDAWVRHVAEVSAPLLRLQVRNYMVHVNDDGSRIFMPYVGGLDRYDIKCQDVAAKGYEGFVFGSPASESEQKLEAAEA